VSSLDTSVRWPTIDGLVVKPIGKRVPEIGTLGFDDLDGLTKRINSEPTLRACPRRGYSGNPAAHLGAAIWPTAVGFGSYLTD
jgi:hypothetical protein